MFKKRGRGSRRGGEGCGKGAEEEEDEEERGKKGLLRTVRKRNGEIKGKEEKGSGIGDIKETELGEKRKREEKGC